MFAKILIRIALCMAMVVTIGCGAGGDGTDNNEIPLPTDTRLDLYCDNVGLYPETCILDDSDNPYAMVNITENVYVEDLEGNQILVSEGNKFDIADDCPSAKSRFYFWATALARSPMGENQYYTAQALHELYTEGGSETAREQAIKAYRSVLDHFFADVTWYEAWWLEGDPAYAVLVRDLTGQSLHDPSEMNLDPLYDDPALALVDMSEWGYVYDEDTQTVEAHD